VCAILRGVLCPPPLVTWGGGGSGHEKGGGGGGGGVVALIEAGKFTCHSLLSASY
jgi:hypothetical protein